MTLTETVILVVPCYTSIAVGRLRGPVTIALSVIIETAASMHVFFTANEVFLVGLMIRANASIFDRVFADSQYSRRLTSGSKAPQGMSHHSWLGCPRSRARTLRVRESV